MMRFFTYSELCQSETARKHGINNYPDETIKARLKDFVEVLLDPIREAWGSPLIVSSGYRSAALNKAVGGSKTSAHTRGYAVDLIPKRGLPFTFFKWLIEFFNFTGLPFDQLIYEKKGSSKWVHIGFKNSKDKFRKQILLYDNGKYSVFNN